MDRAKGCVKEAAGPLSGNKDLKSEGRGDQDKGTLKKKGAAKDFWVRRGLKRSKPYGRNVTTPDFHASNDTKERCPQRR